MHSLKRTLLVILLFTALLLLTGCELSLAEDVTPPPNYRPPVQATDQPAAAEIVFPILPPDPAQGKVLYEEKCLPCHGETGMGDGPVAGNLSNPAAPIGNAELARQSRPVDWYRIVTQGNLERFMPGFSGSLSDRQRWDVVAYVYTLSTSPEELELGKTVYDAQCAACHGLDGKGDGPEAAALSVQPASWKDQSRLAERSSNDLVAIMRAGSEPMHSFDDQLEEPAAYAVADYIRALSFAGSALAPLESASVDPAAQVEDTPAPEATAAAAPGDEPAAQQTAVPEAGSTAAPAEELSAITITGKVSNGTPGGSVPAGLEVELAAFNEMAPAFEVTVDAADDGSYVFEDIEFSPNYVYFIRVTRDALTFNSDILHGRDVLGQQVELPITIYDTTNDPSVLRTDRLHVFFDFTQPGIVQVVNLYVVSNPSGKVVAADGPGEPVVTFDLPENASNLQFQDGTLGERYVQTANGFGDTAAVQPGPMGVNQILFAYELPYDNALDYSMTLPLDVSAATVMIPTVGVDLESDQLVDQGSQTAEGMSFRSFQASRSFAAGETLELSLKGSPGMPGAVPQEDNMTPLLVGLGAFGAVLAGAGYWMYRQRAQQALVSEGVDDDGTELPLEDAPVEDSESILDAIVALDDRHAAGELPEVAYQERRAELKARLAEALAREKDDAGGDAA